jgi:hypothetical protein
MTRGSAPAQRTTLPLCFFALAVTVGLAVTSAPGLGAVSPASTPLIVPMGMVAGHVDHERATSTPGARAGVGAGWNASSPLWRNESLPGAPPDRSDAAMAFDATLNATVVFGGYFTGGACFILTDCPLNDTWEFTGFHWTNVTPTHLTAANNPSARWGASMVYDPAIGGLLLFGGTTATATGLNNPALNDTWEFTSSGWAEVCTAGCLSPSVRWDASFAYSAETSSPILFGGETTTSGTISDLADTWTFTPTANWSEFNPVVAPSARYAATSTWDAQLGGVVLFGGLPSNSQTWLYRNASWHELSPAVSSGIPSARAGEALTGDPLNGSVVLFGGCTAIPCTSGGDSDTWVLTGNNWYDLTSAIGAAPPGRGQAGFVAAGPRGALLLFGGAGTGPRNDTWRIAHVELSPVTALPSTVDVGNSTVLSVTALGGFGPLTLQWNGLPAGCTTANVTVLNCTPSGPGSSTASVFVTASDPAGEVTNSSGAGLIVNARPTVSVAATPRTGTAPLQVTFLATPAGGTGTITFAWEFGDGGAAVGSNPSHTYVSAGTFTAKVWANDTDGQSGTSQSVVTVVAKLTATASFSNSSIVLGASTTLTISISGGAAPYTVRAVGATPGCAENSSAPANAPTFTCTPTDVGTYPVDFHVTDSANQSIDVNATLIVAAPSVPVGGGGSGSGTTPLTPTEELWLIAGAIVAVLLVLALLLRRRGKQPPMLPHPHPEDPMPPTSLYIPPQDPPR